MNFINKCSKCNMNIVIEHKMCKKCWYSSYVICTGCNHKVPPHITPETCNICKYNKNYKRCSGICNSIVAIDIMPETCEKCKLYIKCKCCQTIVRNCYMITINATNNEQICKKCFNQISKINDCINKTGCLQNTPCEYCMDFIKKHNGINLDYCIKLTIGDGTGTVHTGNSCYTPEGEEEINIDKEYTLPVFNDVISNNMNPDLTIYNNFAIPKDECYLGSSSPLCCEYIIYPKITKIILNNNTKTQL